MRLIDADAMLARLEEWNTSDSTDKALYNFTLHRILEQPTIEPQRRKGEWIEDGIYLPRCSVCGGKAYGLHAFDAVKSKYCPHCGAEMEANL